MLDGHLKQAAVSFGIIGATYLVGWTVLNWLQTGRSPDEHDVDEDDVFAEDGSDDGPSTVRVQSQQRRYSTRTRTRMTDRQRDGWPSLLSLVCDIAEDRSRRDGVIHRSINCDRCQMTPIRGTRYKCLNCPDYDLCEQCEAQHEHDPRHIFAKIDIPLPPHAQPIPNFSTIPGGNPATVEELTWAAMKQYRRSTRFMFDEIRALHDQFSCWATSSEINYAAFCRALGRLGDGGNMAVQRLFQLFSGGEDAISFQSFLNAMSLLTKGTRQNKIQAAFQGYDVKQRGYITRDDVYHLLKAALDLNLKAVDSAVQLVQAKLIASFEEDNDRPVSAAFTNNVPETETNLLTEAQEKALVAGLLNDSIQFDARDPGHEQVVKRSDQALRRYVAAIFNEQPWMDYGSFEAIAQRDSTLVSWIDACGTVF